MRTILLIATVALGLTAVHAQAATPVHSKKHKAALVCKDKLLCRKVDALSKQVAAGNAGLSDTIKAGQAQDAEFQKQELTYSEAMVTTLKSVEAQGAKASSAIFLSFAERKLEEGENADTVANTVCVTDGFKAGKPVEVAHKHGWSNSGTYLNSVVCTF